MAPATVVLITGIGRGIGKEVAATHLLRPNHIVIGSVRDSSDPKYQVLKGLPTADGSKLLLVSIESTSLTDPAKAVKEIEAAGVSHIDTVIANSGICPPPAPPDSVDMKDVMDGLHVNTAGPIVLFQAVKPLLDKSSAPKWMTVSTAAASIGNLENSGTAFVCAYGVSKAGLNFFTQAIHCTNKNWTVLSVHPGLVQTEMGNAGAKMIGMEEAPVTVKQASTKMIAYLDGATREKTGGKFFDVIEDTELLW